MFVESENSRSTDLSTLFGENLASKIKAYSWGNSRRHNSLRSGRGVLHAKATVADDDQLFISSANLTEFAMSVNIEVGVLIRGGGYARKVDQLFDNYINQGLFERLDVVEYGPTQRDLP